VYCDSGTCLLVPTVCRNLSRIVRSEAGTAPSVVGHAVDAAPLVPATSPLLPELALGELVFDPPGAGPAASTTVSSFDDATLPGAWGVPVWAPWGSAGAVLGVLSLPGDGGGSPAARPGEGFVPNPLSGGGWPDVSAVQLPPVVPAVPEPGTWALMVLGLSSVLLAGRGRRRQSQQR
jgi:hypothetical protein